MRYATIGTSWITEAFIEGAAIAGGLELAAIYSRNSQTGTAFAERYGGIPVFTDLESLAKSPSIGAVYIASPNFLHYSQSKLFLKNGKHVLCEKPSTITSAQQRELTALSQSRGLVYMEAIMMLHLPSRTLLHEALQRIGHITTAHLDFSQFSSKYPAYLAGNLPNIFNPTMAAGCLMDLGIYCVYAAIDLFGLPRRIIAHSGFLPSGADGFGSAIFVYEDKQVSLTYSKTGQSHTGSEILGDKGTITIGSISKLTDIVLIPLDDAESKHELIVGDIPKAVLMSSEAANFCRYASDPVGYILEIKDANEIALSVCSTMEVMRQQTGIRFSDDQWT